MKKIFIAGLLAVSAVFATQAKFAIWQMAPKYDNLTRYYNDIYAFEQNGKYGLVKADGTVLSDAQNDFITSFTAGYALAGVKINNQYQLLKIISENGDVFNVGKKVYLGPVKYFSEGMLPVADASGKFGYVDPRGNILIRFQFDQAGAFKEGFAPVKKGNYAMFITPAYDSNPSRSTLIVDFHYGEMTMAGCFKDGLAPIRYNNDCALVNRSGKVVNKISEASFNNYFKQNNASPQESNPGFTETTSYSIFTNNGKSGLRDASGLIASSQFDALGPMYSDGAIIAKQNGMVGILKVNDGNFSLSSHSKDGGTNLTSQNGSVGKIEYVWEGPFNQISNYSLYVDKGDGSLSDVTSQAVISGNRAKVTFEPIFPAKAKNFTVKGAIADGGIILGAGQSDYTVKYPAVLRVGAPGPKSVRANENGVAYVSATIYNDSDESMTVSYNWSTGTSGSATIGAHSSKTVSTSVSVTSTFTKTISITANGKSASSSITFTGYF